MALSILSASSSPQRSAAKSALVQSPGGASLRRYLRISGAGGSVVAMS